MLTNEVGEYFTDVDFFIKFLSGCQFHRKYGGYKYN